MGFFDKLFGGKSKDENTAKFTNQSKTVLTPLQGKVLALSLIHISEPTRPY